MYRERSGCRIARWTYAVEKGSDLISDCEYHRGFSQELQDPSQLKGNDTIYVPHTNLDQFVNEVLDRISSDVVVISGRTQNTEGGKPANIQRLLDSTRVLGWFCQNMELYGGDDLHHRKIHPFPYGMKEYGQTSVTIRRSFKRAFLNTLSKEKTELIFAGPLAGRPTRAGIPSLPRMKPEEYHDRIAVSMYLLSPAGDRPECFRHVRLLLSTESLVVFLLTCSFCSLPDACLHLEPCFCTMQYEAIGLGAVPITDLGE